MAENEAPKDSQTETNAPVEKPSAPVAQPSTPETEPSKPAKKQVSIGMRVFGILNLVAGLVDLYGWFWLIPKITEAMDAGTLGAISSTTRLIVTVYTLTAVLSAAMFIILGIRLFMGNTRKAGMQTNAMLVLSAIALFSCIMLQGIKAGAWIEFGVILYLGVLHVKIDPALRAEREQDFKKYQDETKERSEAGDIGFDRTGQGFIELNFFNLFWIWIIGCFAGCVVETIYCFIERGVIENRTGLLWGWWSPIYGFGALGMTIILNRFRKRSFLALFVGACLIGAGTEFMVSWFLEMAFNIKAWDYSGAFLNIAGRTDLFHALAFGTFGTVWVKCLQTPVIKLINSIPWKLRYGVTLLAFLFMLTNCVMTMLSIDCWVNRVNGTNTDTPIEQFFAENYPNDWMQQHFETMTITPDPNRLQKM